MTNEGQTEADQEQRQEKGRLLTLKQCHELRESWRKANGLTLQLRRLMMELDIPFPS